MRVAVIGAGAAGFFAAIRIAESDARTQVILYEATGKTLAKLLISGGGRCNVTTATRGARELSQYYPRGSKELIGPFSTFDAADTVRWFEDRGVALITESDGRMFPSTHSSRTVANCLRQAAEQAGVLLKLHSRLNSITQENGTFILSVGKDNLAEAADAVVLTTGGAKSGFKLATSLGHSIVEPVPSLFSFEIQSELLSGLQGVSFQNLPLTLNCNGKRFSQEGPVLITHWGLSGPAVIKLSARAARELHATGYQASLRINFLPEYAYESCRAELQKYQEGSPGRKAHKHCPFDLPHSFWERALLVSSVAADDTCATLSKKKLGLLANTLTAADLPVTGKGRFKEEFVTAGGVRLSEVNFKTMESKVCPGLYFAGEILDIDGLTGGYNFQSAWTTAWLAANGISSKQT